MSGLLKKHCVKTLVSAGVHNIRPAGKMWPTEAFYLARKAQNVIYSACLLENSPSDLLQKYRFWPLDMLPNFFLARLRFEMCIPALECHVLIECPLKLLNLKYFLPKQIKCDKNNRSNSSHSFNSVKDNKNGCKTFF